MVAQILEILEILEIAVLWGDTFLEVLEILEIGVFFFGGGGTFSGGLKVLEIALFCGPPTLGLPWAHCIFFVFFSHVFLFSRFPWPLLGLDGTMGGPPQPHVGGWEGGGRVRQRKTAKGVKSVRKTMQLRSLRPKSVQHRKKVFRRFTVLGECIALSMLFVSTRFLLFLVFPRPLPPGAGGDLGAPNPRGGHPRRRQGGATKSVNSV